MKRQSVHALAVLLLLGPLSATVAVGQHKIWTVVNGGAVPPPSLKSLAPGNSGASIVYLASLSGDVVTGALSSYCVYPSIHITGAQGVASPGLTVELINAAGMPAATGFEPITVTTTVQRPPPASTTLELHPQPAWCAAIAGGRVAPAIYLQVGRYGEQGAYRELVIFAKLPVLPVPNTSPR